MWQWKDNSEKVVPKISYVKGYKTWGWIVGTGMYLDDVHAEIAAIRNSLSAISAGILVIVSLLALYSIRQSLMADRERQRIFLERENLMKSLEESKERFRNLLETTSDWIGRRDREGRYTYSSPHVLRPARRICRKRLSMTPSCDIVAPADQATTFVALV